MCSAPGARTVIHSCGSRTSSSTMRSCSTRSAASRAEISLTTPSVCDKRSPAGNQRPMANIKIGYFLSSEELGPREQVQLARKAEESGIDRVWISDHYHPWTDDQGQSPFVWSVIGGIAAATDLTVTTAVTCPTYRIHPAIIAQAAATCAVMTRGKFILGLGSGEALNEHIL